MKCLNCKKEISDNAKYCSDKCRMAYTRRTKKGELPEQNDPNIHTRTLDFKATRTDQLFEAYRKDYYAFDNEIYEHDCLAIGCGKEFKTHLERLRFCSPQHMEDTLNKLTA